MVSLAQGHTSREWWSLDSHSIPPDSTTDSINSSASLKKIKRQPSPWGVCWQWERPVNISFQNNVRSALNILREEETTSARGCWRRLYRGYDIYAVVKKRSRSSPEKAVEGRLFQVEREHSRWEGHRQCLLTPTGSAGFATFDPWPDWEPPLWSGLQELRRPTSSTRPKYQPQGD